MKDSSTPELIGRLGTGLMDFVTAELGLVRIETTEKISGALSAVGTIVVAAVFAIVALVFLLQGLVAFLVGLGWAPYLANLAVGGGILFIALIAIIVAAQSLANLRIVPERSLRQIRAATAIGTKGKSA